MVNNLSEQAGQGGESNLVEKIRDSAATIWLAGLGAFSKGQEESGKIFDALVKEGEAVQSRASKSAQEKISDVRTKATEAWGQLEQVFEDRVERTLNRLSVPSKHDIDTLSKNVADLTRAVTKLSHSLDEGKKA